MTEGLPISGKDKTETGHRGRDDRLPEEATRTSLRDHLVTRPGHRTEPRPVRSMRGSQLTVPNTTATVYRASSAQTQPLLSYCVAADVTDTVPPLQGDAPNVS